MPTPVAHSLLGVAWAVGVLMPTRLSLQQAWAHIRRHAAAYLLVVGMSLCPDVDFLPGLLTGSLNGYHQVTTHSLAWGFMVSLGVMLVTSSWLQIPAWRWWLILMASVGIHYAADLCTVDLGTPVGMPLAWPWSDFRFNGPVLLFLNVDKASLGDAVQLWNLKVVAWEILVTLPVLLAVWRAKRHGQVAPFLFKPDMEGVAPSTPID